MKCLQILESQKCILVGFGEIYSDQHQNANLFACSILRGQFGVAWGYYYIMLLWVSWETNVLHNLQSLAQIHFLGFFFLNLLKALLPTKENRLVKNQQMTYRKIQNHLTLFTGDRRLGAKQLVQQVVTTHSLLQETKHREGLADNVLTMLAHICCCHHHILS